MDLTIFMISFKSSFENTSVVVHNPKIFLGITISVADAAAVNPKGSKTLLANVLSTFSIKITPVLVMVQEFCLKILLTLSS